MSETEFIFDELMEFSAEVELVEREDLGVEQPQFTGAQYSSRVGGSVVYHVDGWPSAYEGDVCSQRLTLGVG